MHTPCRLHTCMCQLNFFVDIDRLPKHQARINAQQVTSACSAPLGMQRKCGTCIR